jgi:hypothetical protein
MAALDGFVDFVAGAEVVAGDDEGFQFSGGPGRVRRATIMICSFPPRLRKTA